MELRLSDTGGVERPIIDGVVSLEEDRHYSLTVEGVEGEVQAWRDGQPLPCAPGSSRFPLYMGFAVGEVQLEARAGSTDAACLARVIPRQEKLDEATWIALLEELDAWLGGISVGLEGLRHGSVGLDGMPAPLLVEALLPLVPQVERTFRAVAEQPRLRQMEQLRQTPLHRTRKVSREVHRWLGRHPDVSAWLDPWRAAELEGGPPDVPVRHLEEDLHHMANRFLAWLLRRVESALEGTAAALTALAGKASGELLQQGQWCEGRAVLLRRAVRRLARLRRQTFFGSLQPHPATEAALLVVADDPLYARAHRAARPFLSPRFQLNDGCPGASIRPTFHLYELWCFLAVQRHLEATLQNWKWSHSGHAKLKELTGTGAGAAWTGRGPDGQVQLLFNPTFAGYFNRAGRARWSLSRERRPDLVLTWEGKDGARSWLCLDAKYRAGRQNLADAMSSVHIYRDALRDEEHGGPCKAALLLAPREAQDAADWFTTAYRNAHGIGIVELRPGGGMASELGPWLMERLRP